MSNKTTEPTEADRAFFDQLNTEINTAKSYKPEYKHVDKPLRFDPNSNEHLEWALKLAYRYAAGDMSAATEETRDAVADALCNLIGDEGFCQFVENEVCVG